MNCTVKIRCVSIKRHFGRAGGISDNQTCMEEKSSDRNFVHQAFQCIVSAFAKLDPFLAHGCERRSGVGADGKIVKSDDTDIVRNAVSHLLALDHSSIGNKIVAAYDGGNPEI